MKRLGIALYAALAVALTGCRDNAQDQRIAKLEAKLAAQEAVVSEASRNAVFSSNAVMTIKDWAGGLADVVATNSRELTDALYGTNYPSLGLASLQFGLCLDRLERIEALTNRITGRPVYLPSQPQRQTGMKNGVPTDIYNAIAEKAAEEWPTDFHMQAYEIKEQVDAYKKLHQ